MCVHKYMRMMCMLECVCLCMCGLITFDQLMTHICVMAYHKVHVIGCNIGEPILGVILQYMVSASFSCLLVKG